MASILVRNIDDDLKARLRVQAARHGRSMEAEAREILRESVMRDQETSGNEPTAGDLFRRIGRWDEDIDEDDDFDLMDYIPPRELPRDAPTFD